MKELKTKLNWYFCKVRKKLLSFKYPRPDIILSFRGGLGDHLLCTILCRELKNEGKRIWFVTDYPDLFKYNSDIDRVLSIELAKKLKLNIRYVYYEMPPVEEKIKIPDCHIVKTMCNHIGINKKTILLRPVLHLTNKEKSRGRIAKNKIIISSSGMSARYPIITKEWFPEYYQQVVTSLKGKYDFIQVGSTTDTLLEGVIDMRGKLKLRETAAILSNALLYIGQVGFLMHLARSVDCLSVIIYGGREEHWQSGYKRNYNLFVKTACSPCWSYICSKDRVCLRQVTPMQVIEAVEQAKGKNYENGTESLYV